MLLLCSYNQALQKGKKNLIPESDRLRATGGFLSPGISVSRGMPPGSDRRRASPRRP
jgi:hypothetical protein